MMRTKTAAVISTYRSVNDGGGGGCSGGRSTAAAATVMRVYCGSRFCFNIFMMTAHGFRHLSKKKALIQKKPEPNMIRTAVSEMRVYYVSQVTYGTVPRD